MSECAYNHNNIKSDRFTSELVFCPLASDSEAKTICKRHCLMIQGLFDTITHLMRQTISREELVEDPTCFHEHLSPKELDLVKQMEIRRDWDNARLLCLSCNPLEVNPNPDIVPIMGSIEATNATILRKAEMAGDTEIRFVGKDRLEV